jgi:hypothetical protein
MLKENDYFVVRSIVVLLGVLGRRKNNPEVRFVFREENYQHKKIPF